MKIAVVDIGSNTVKMKIYVALNNVIEEVYSAVKNAKLISYIKDNMLSADGIALLCNIINEFKTSANEHSVDVFSCFATASLRRTSNIQEVRTQVKAFCNEEIDLIPGNLEAFYSFSGVKHTSPSFPEEAILLDMGGGSTEIVYCKNGEKAFAESMNFGSLSLYLDHPENDFDSMRKQVSDSIEQISFYPIKTKNAILVGGTALAIYSLYARRFKNEPINTMNFKNLKILYDILLPLDDYVLSLLKKEVPHRITTVVPGLSAYMEIFEKCGVENITVSTCGIREGYVYEKILKNTEIEK